MKKALCAVICCLLLLFCSCGMTENESGTVPEKTEERNPRFLDAVRERGYLIAGCKKDVPGLGFYNKETGTWDGLEIELAYQTAANLFGVTAWEAKDRGLVQFVGRSDDCLLRAPVLLFADIISQLIPNVHKSSRIFIRLLSIHAVRSIFISCFLMFSPTKNYIALMSRRTLSAIRAIYSLLVGLVLPDDAEYPNIFSKVCTFPLPHETSMAFRMARSTFWSVVLNLLAMVGYNSFVTLVTTSISLPDSRIASRRN